MVDVSKLDPAVPLGDVEDRRQEFTPWQHLLLQLGIPPIDDATTHRDPGKEGFFNTADYLNNTAPKTIPTKLSIDAGRFDIDKPEYERKFQPEEWLAYTGAPLKKIGQK